ncbi:MAG: YkgJ family cysteine cluster protein [Methylococcaceae bacterium]|nr:YkgJ family cysteine cluster protein [Methylococcaceae bacterium]
MTGLVQLFEDVEMRVASIRDAHGDWPCRSGCDGCCRRLAEVPWLTQTEWIWLQAGLSRLPPEQFRDIGRSIAVLAEKPSTPVVCPMLQRSDGTCRVYPHRPLACRTYGFYMQRGVGLYCKEIEARVAAGRWAGVVWGNQDALERRCAGLGEPRALTEWFLNWEVWTRSA